MPGEIMLRNRRGQYEVVLVPEPSEPTGAVMLRPAWRQHADDDWTASPITSSWTADDLRRAADWWRVAARRAEPRHAFAGWYGDPPVGFLVIERDTGTAAVDVCWLEHAVPTGDDRRFSYWTIDMTTEAVLAVAAGFDALAGQA